MVCVEDVTAKRVRTSQRRRKREEACSVSKAILDALSQGSQRRAFATTCSKNQGMRLYYSVMYRTITPSSTAIKIRKAEKYPHHLGISSVW